jgi:Transposase IS116/IS110/IS902 family
LAAIQPGCKALQRQYGIGKLTAVIIWAELGDTRRFSASRHAVRHTGLDISVSSSNGKRTRGHLARQGPPLLRWALFEAAKSAANPTSPDHAYYLQATDSVPAPTAPRCRWPASWLGAVTTPCASSVTRRLPRCESWTSRVCLPADQPWWRRGWLLRVTAARPPGRPEQSERPRLA